MEYSRRDVVKTAGLAAMAVGLSCDSNRAPVEPERQKGAEDMAEEGAKHRVFVKRCGHYVVVEAAETGLSSYRGKLEVAPGDRVDLHNQTGGTVRLDFPEGVVWDRDTMEANPVKIVEGDRSYELTAQEGKKQLKIADDAPEGRYEYTVLFDVTILARDGQVPPIVSRWVHALGGSSAEFIIRRSRAIT